ncbi:MAG: hypothetical protein V3V32_03195 [Dehalococcoidia bacterium]
MSKIEVEGKFGTFASTKARASRDKLEKLLRYYRSPEGKEYLRQMLAEEDEFVRMQREAEMKPIRIPVEVDGFRLTIRELDPQTLMPGADIEITIEEEREDGEVSEDGGPVDSDRRGVPDRE